MGMTKGAVLAIGRQNRELRSEREEAMYRLRSPWRIAEMYYGNIHDGILKKSSPSGLVSPYACIQGIKFSSSLTLYLDLFDVLSSSIVEGSESLTFMVVAEGPWGEGASNALPQTLEEEEEVLRRTNQGKLCRAVRLCGRWASLFVAHARGHV
ncbi:hypothetical protein HPP92_009403 [Vanilla planifolia]|uniref:Uncharacterized protein n=1 Tax=Vanilla planifolia TaxID=51239 RepID=A0A835RJ91_VANPL|nr:hypothetical protein HPP92_009403 [Vanilla planifolia]